MIVRISCSFIAVVYFLGCKKRIKQTTKNKNKKLTNYKVEDKGEHQTTHNYNNRPKSRYHKEEKGGMVKSVFGVHSF